MDNRYEICGRFTSKVKGQGFEKYIMFDNVFYIYNNRKDKKSLIYSNQNNFFSEKLITKVYKDSDEMYDELRNEQILEKII